MLRTPEQRTRWAALHGLPCWPRESRWRWWQATYCDDFSCNDVCAVCHNEIFKRWETTPHASAYETLLKAEHEYDPECLQCHTIGLSYFTGFETIETTPEMKGVGCESCHGPGSNHNETQSKDYGKADIEICETCHESEHSPNFQYEEYWKKIMHPLKE